MMARTLSGKSAGDGARAVVRGRASPLNLTGLAAAALLMLGSPVSAQQLEAKRAFQFQPRLDVGTVVTDGRRASDGSVGSEWITTITPGLHWRANGASVSGSLDYSAAALIHARDGEANQVQHRLRTGLAVQAIEDHLSVDLTGQISTQARSALALQAADAATPRAARTHVASFSVSPLWRGRPRGLVDLSLGATVATTRQGEASLSDSSTGQLTARVGSVAGRTLLGWSVQASRQVVDFDRGRATEEDRILAGLGFTPSPEFSVDLRAGVESSDVASASKQSSGTWGAGLRWTPTPRTQISLSGDRRSFGHAHALQLQHRMRRSVWRYSDRQDVSTGANAGSSAVPAYDLFYALFASQEPDPVLREQLVNSFLLRNNIAPDAQLNGGLLTSASAVQRRREASLALQGQRTTVVMSAFQTDSHRAYALAGAADDLSAGGLRQRGVVFTVTHRLTPRATLGLTAQASRSTSPASASYSALDSFTLNWNQRVGRRTSMTLGLRHSESETATERLDENALLANLHMAF